MTDNTDTNQLRVGIVGMGAIGAVLAAHLIDAGLFVVCCDIDREKIDAIKKEGISLENLIRKKVSVEEACYSTEELGKFDLNLVIIAVKTPSLGKVLAHISKIASEKMFAMCAQNGMDNELEVAEVFGRDKTLRMVINFAGGMSNPTTVNVAFFNPPNYIAALAQEGKALAARIADLLNSVNLKTEITDNIRKYIWEKVILNSALSPVCAITKLTMKDVMDFPEGQEMAQSIIDESIAVARAEGITYGENFREFCIKYLKGGGKHRPSMLVDLDNGLKTEIDYLNGKIAEYGRKHGLPTPHNRAITAFIHMLELSSK